MNRHMKQRHVEDRVRQISLPAPSAQLRDRVLSIAATAQASISWSDRIWFSHAWRVAAVGAALAVAVLDQVTSSRGPAAFTPSPQAVAEAKAIDEAVREIGLPQEVAAALARRVLSEASRIPVPPRFRSEQLQEFTRESGGD
jgi:hypothetical protein